MKRNLFRIFGLTVGLVMIANVGAKADETPKASADDMAKMMEMFKPSPQMEMMSKSRTGKWTFTGTMAADPTTNSPASTMKGAEEVKLIHGGLWAVTHTTGKAGDMDFEGTGVCGWNPKKAKFEGNWVDCMALGMTTYEGTISEDGKSATYVLNGPGMTGEMTTTTMIDQMTDANHRSWKSWKGTDTSGPPMMEMTYTRSGGAGKTGKTK